MEKGASFPVSPPFERDTDLGDDLLDCYRTTIAQVLEEMGISRKKYDAMSPAKKRQIRFVSPRPPFAVHLTDLLLRAYRNKVSARAFRARKKSLVESLESQIVDKDHLIESLRKQVLKLQAANFKVRLSAPLLVQCGSLLTSRSVFWCLTVGKQISMKQLLDRSDPYRCFSLFCILSLAPLFHGRPSRLYVLLPLILPSTLVVFTYHPSLSLRLITRARAGSSHSTLYPSVVAIDIPSFRLLLLYRSLSSMIII